MKITIISPSMGKVRGRNYVKTWSLEPLNLAVLASLTPKNIEIEFIDDRFEEIPEHIDSDLVAMPVETYTAKRTYIIADQFRAKKIPVVLGGIQASLVPDEVQKHADSIVIGNAEQTWPKLLHDLENHNLQASYTDQTKNGILQHTVPDRSIYSHLKYAPIKLIETGRGCPFYCDFCAIAGSYNGSYRSKDLDDIISDVVSAKAPFYYFVDDNFVSKKQRTIELCDALAPLNIHWFSQGSINMANDENFLKSLERSGCTNILVGFETLNPATLKDMGKSWNIAKQNLSESIKKFRDNGITLYGTFVFGYDNDTEDDIKRTLDFAINEKINLAAFNHLVPFPGTPLYNRLKNEGRLLDNEWWLKDNYRFGDVTFMPKNFSPERLSELCYQARCDFYSYKSIAKRVWEFSANSKDLYTAAMSIYINLVSLNGVKERQHWPVGEVISKKEFAYR